MNIFAFQQFLRSLGGSLAALDVPHKSREDLRSVVDAFEPFKDLDLGQLADFLKRAATYRQDGSVSPVNVNGLDEATNTARKVSEAVQALSMAEPSRMSELEGQIIEGKEQLQSALNTMAGNFGFTVTFKHDKTWLPNISKKASAKRAAEEMRVASGKVAETLREVLPQITEPAAYHTETVTSAINDIAATDAEILKAAALELGASGISVGRKFDGKKFVESVLVKLTGVELKPSKSPKKPKPTKTELPDAPIEQVDSMVKSLQDMLDKTKDPDAVPDSEIDAILNRVSSEFSETQQKAIAKQVTGKGGRTAKGAIENLRTDLTAVRRALESQKV